MNERGEGEVSREPVKPKGGFDAKALGTGDTEAPGPSIVKDGTPFGATDGAGGKAEEGGDGKQKLKKFAYHCESPTFKLLDGRV